MSISKLAAKLIGDKKRWRDYKARVKNLPEPYRASVDAFEAYLMFFGPTDANSAASIFENLADLFEQSAADKTPIREIVGADPVEFIEEFLRNYPDQAWRRRERQKLTDTINRLAGGKA